MKFLYDHMYFGGKEKTTYLPSDIIKRIGERKYAVYRDGERINFGNEDNKMRDDCEEIYTTQEEHLIQIAKISGCELEAIKEKEENVIQAWILRW